MSGVTFTVAGVPAPQGSKTRTRWGGMREANDATRPWRQAVLHEAVLAMNGRDPLTGGLELRVVLRFPRPKSHYGTGRNAGVLKASAPMWHTVKPDVDKLVRAIGDSLTGVVVRDDSQFARVVAAKVYGTPGAQITVSAEPLDEAASLAPLFTLLPQAGLVGELTIEGDAAANGGCLNGWGPGGCTYTDGHYCNLQAEHAGRCRCSCGATTTQALPGPGDAA